MQASWRHYIHTSLVSEERHEASSMVGRLYVSALERTHYPAGGLVGVILDVIGGDEQLDNPVLRS